MTATARGFIVSTMAPFGTADRDRLDFQLMMRSPVTWIHSRPRLAQTVSWLRDHDYHVVSVDASWLITSHMFRDLGGALGYVCHDQWQCLGEGLAEGVHEALQRSAGFALVLSDFDTFTRHHGDDAANLLGLLAEQAWRSSLLGKKVLCLAHTEDPNLKVRPTILW